MSQAHINQNLQIQRSIPIDANTTFLAHYDISVNDINGLAPCTLPVTDDTMIYYDFSEITSHSSGAYILDKSMYNNWAKAYSCTITTGRNGNALNLNGVNGYVESTYGLNIDPSASPHSFEVWVKTPVTTGSYVVLSTDTDTNRRLYIGKTGGMWDIGIKSSAWGTSTTAVVANKWTHLILTMDGTNARLYVDGVLAVTKAYTSYTWASNITLGRIAASSYWWDGQIDKVAVLNRVLTVEEIAKRSNDSVYTMNEAGKYGGSVKIDSGKLWYDKSILNTNAFTISCWYNPITIHTQLSGNPGIYSSYHLPIIELAPATDRGLTAMSMAIEPDRPAINYLKRPCLYINNIKYYNGTPVENDTWNNMVLTYDGTNYKLYQNGNLVITHAGAPITPYPDSYVMVGGGYLGRPNILIDEVRIDNVARTPEEIMTWYVSNNPFYPKGNERMVY